MMLILSLFYGQVLPQDSVDPWSLQTVSVTCMVSSLSVFQMLAVGENIYINNLNTKQGKKLLTMTYVKINKI